MYASGSRPTYCSLAEPSDLNVWIFVGVITKNPTLPKQCGIITFSVLGSCRYTVLVEVLGSKADFVVPVDGKCIKLEPLEILLVL